MHTVVLQGIGNTIWRWGAPNGAPMGRRQRAARWLPPDPFAAAPQCGPAVHTQPGANYPAFIDWSNDRYGSRAL
eukprot:213022-Chlamydomonas_euryale.AAC.1